MTSRHLHIVSFNVPWPADYGGVIDVFNRIRQLHDEGALIHLHNYTYGRAAASELEQYCYDVHYYQRANDILHQISCRPFIASSRCSQQLLHRLLLDNYPIWIEGLHCCWILEQIRKRQPDRQIFVRTHNIEHEYYHELAQVETRWWKRFFFNIESYRLRHYEHVLAQSDAIFAISKQDYQYFANKQYCPRVELLLPCVPSAIVQNHEGRGTYWLYHGNLSVGENEAAVRYLIKEVAPYVPYPLFVAGRQPSPTLAAAVASCPNATLVADPSADHMADLVRNAQVICLVTGQATGIKLKLIDSLVNGRFCVTNSKMVAHTGLESLCLVEDDPLQMAQTISGLMQLDYTNEMVQHRVSVLNSHRLPILPFLC